MYCFRRACYSTSAILTATVKVSSTSMTSQYSLFIVNLPMKYSCQEDLLPKMAFAVIKTLAKNIQKPIPMMVATTAIIGL